MYPLKKYSDIENLDVYELEAILREYPWFSYARDVMLCKLAKLGKECFDSGIRSSAAFIVGRERLLKKAHLIFEKNDVEINSNSDCINFDEIKSEADRYIFNEQPIIKKEERKYIPGGDYFSKEDLESFSNNNSFREFGINLQLTKDDVIDPDPNVEANDKDSIFDSPEFMTETLAKIYSSQCYYDKALEVYKKLILLYPEKNAYFASLIEEIKFKNK
jgi:hypothetical protein